MRKIKFKHNQNEEFADYIDIGSCERDYFYIHFFTIEENKSNSGKLYFKTYNEWFKKFKNESIGSKMLIINYYLSQYLGWHIGENSPQIEFSKDVFGEKITDIISTNLDYLLNFNNKYFHHESSLFKGLDFDFEDIEETFLSIEETEDGILTEIVFKDGSELQFTNENDNIRSFFIPENEYFNLKKEIKIILDIFSPNNKIKHRLNYY